MSFFIEQSGIEDYVIEDNNTQVIIEHPSYEFKIVIDASGLGDFFSHQFEFSVAEGDKQVSKRNNHSHFWIKDGLLYESYNTIRGMRFMEVMKVEGMPDEDNCSDDCMEYIVKNYLN